MKKLVLATLLAAASSFSFACNDVKHQVKPQLCDSCATVQSVKMEKRKGEGCAVGIIGGAVVGGALGNQIGGGSGKKIATVGGAVAGGFAGNEVQKHVTSKEVWVTQVKLKDGSVRKFEQEAKPAWKTGSIVKVRENKTLSL